MKHCLSEEENDEVDSDKRHTEADSEDDNNNKVLENDAIESQPMEAWHDDADKEVVEKKKVTKFSIRKWIGNLFGGCVRKNIES